MDNHRNGGYLNRSDFHGMDLNLLEVENREKEDKPDQLLFGTLAEGIVPSMPGVDEFDYDVNCTLRHLKPYDDHLIPPNVDERQPPPGKFYPSPPPSGYTLEETTKYTRGYVYAADYHLSMLEIHKRNLINISTPPIVTNPSDGKSCIYGMVRMVPGVPFVLKLNGNDQRTHTFACLQTLESLKMYPDYDDILKASIHLAKLTWGCAAEENQLAIPPVYELDGLKFNDRSSTRPFLDNARDGSYSLGHTVMKGEGLGTVLPSVQANTTQADAQIRTILKTLHTLRRLIMPKCLSKFEHDIWDFHQDYNNVFSFGGLAPNGTSVQLNVSSLGTDLGEAIGILQGYWHTDFKDDCQFWTIFTLLFRIGPDGEPGEFFLARGGVYVQELGVWILFLVFKGTDPHSGVAPREDAKKHADWVQSIVDPMWNMTGPQNRVGYVNYINNLSSKRQGSANITPPTNFGNYGSSVVHKATQKNFSTHGHTTMGLPGERADRLGRELVSNLYNAISLTPNLFLDLDINALLESLYYIEDGVQKHLQPYPYHPINDREHIKRYLALYSWHLLESNTFNLGITTKMIKAASSSSSTVDVALAITLSKALDFDLDANSDVLDISEVLAKRTISGRTVFTVRLANCDEPVNIPQSHPTVQANTAIQTWLMNNVDGLKTLAPMHIDSSTQLTDQPSPTVHDVPKSASPHITETTPTSVQDPAIHATSEGQPAIPTVPSVSPLDTIQDALPKDSMINTVPSTTQSSGPSTRAKAAALATNPPPTVDKSNEATITSAEQKKKGSANGKRKPRNERSRSRSLSDDEDNGLSTSARDDNYRDQNREPSPTPSVSNNYGVEAILDHNFTDSKNKQWLVKWEGCNETAWVVGRDLYHCSEMLGDYHRRHGLEHAHLAHDIAPKTFGKVTIDERTDAASELAANLHQLELLLDESRLDNEIVALVYQFQRAVNGGKEYWSSHTSTSTLASIWIDHCSATSRLSECLPFFELKPTVSGFIKFKLVQTSVAILPSMNAVYHQLDLIGRGFQWEMCRALVSVFDWFTQDGPQLSQLLVDIYAENGFAGLQTQVAPFAKLVDHLVQYVYASFANIIDQRPRTKRQRIDRVSAFDQYKNFPRTHFGDPIPTERLDRIPTDLYGLIDRKKVATLKLPSITPKRFPIKTDPTAALFTVTRICLEDLWSKEIVMPPLQSLDAHPLLPKTSANLATLRERLITRGAILKCLTDVCETDAIFASDGMKSFLARPTQDFFPAVQGDSRRAAKLMSEERDDALTTMRESMSSYVDERPAVRHKINRLGDLVEAHLSAIHNGGSVDCDNNPLDHDDMMESMGLASGESAVKSGGSKPKLKVLHLAEWGPGLPELQAHSLPASVSLAPLAFILREALNRKRGLLPANDTMARILNGQHPLLSSTTTFPPFQTDPIRQTSDYAILVEKHLPGKLLTTPTGISSLLTWMGTGQGYTTKDFLATIIRPTGFFSFSMDEQLEVFRPIISSNQTLRLQADLPEGSLQLKNIPGYIACYDQHIWSPTPNNLFNIYPTRSRGNVTKVYGTIEDKFALYWDESVQNRWIEFLGGLANENPDDWTGHRPSWSEAMAFFQSLKIPIFGQGLTVLQTVNNLVFANIVSMPTQDNIVRWIIRNHTKGAFRALEIFGFPCLHLLEGVTFAFNAIYDHLDKHLSDSDKKILCLSPIFLEHALCKVSRWQSRLKGNATLNFQTLLTRLENDTPQWISNDNLTNRLAIPFPLTIAQSRLQEIRDSL